MQGPLSVAVLSWRSAFAGDACARCTNVQKFPSSEIISILRNWRAFMTIKTSIALEDRGIALSNWRRTLGWGLAEAANRLGITTRTLSSHESGAQPIPESRWRLFVHEIGEVLRTGKYPGGLVIVNGEDGLSCIDVVSADNYAGIAISDDGKRGVIASYAIDRQTGAPYLHQVQFHVDTNRHLFKAVEAWEEVRRSQSDDEAVYHAQRWIMRMALSGEINHPEMASLKRAMNDANQRLKAAEGASAEERNRLFQEHEAAVVAFVKALAAGRPKG